MEAAIILCTRNGSSFIEEQIDSLLKQSRQNFDLYISDDSSSDNTLSKIKNRLSGEKLNYKIFTKNYNSSAINFIETTKHLDKEYDYYFFCDQDDVWFRKKVDKSIRCLKKLKSDIPLLYCSSTVTIDENSNIRGKSQIFKKPPSLNNALVQSLAGGNTMCFNKIAKDLLIRVDSQKHITSHDWILYLIVTAMGGEVFYDKSPSLYYRRHSKNQIGPNNTFFEKLTRLKKLIKGEFRIWTCSNINILKQFDLPKQSQEIVTRLENIRNSDISDRIQGCIKLSIYRQNFFSNITLYLALIFKKI